MNILNKTNGSILNIVTFNVIILIQDKNNKRSKLKNKNK